MKKGIVLGCMVAFAFTLGAWAEEAAKPAPAAKADASTVFSGKCAMCHGKSGKGNAAMAKVFKVDASALDLTSPSTKDMKDGDLTAVISKGRNKMPAFSGKLKDPDITGVASYVRTLQKSSATSAPADKK